MKPSKYITFTQERFDSLREDVRLDHVKLEAGGFRPLRRAKRKNSKNRATKGGQDDEQ